MIKFSFEVPIKHLNTFHDKQDYIFALSFLCKNKPYWEYLKQCRRDNCTIILDNSYNELKVATPVEEMLDIFYPIEADYMICPDNDLWPIDKYMEVLDEVKLNISLDKLYMVARNPLHYKAFKDAGVKNIAIPYEFRPWYFNYNNDGFSADRNSNFLKNSHFLGLNTYYEPKAFQCNSCDTSMPIKLALEGITLERWIEKGCYHIDTDLDFFRLEMTKEQVETARHNIDILKRITNKKEEV